jgi:cobalt/nickel transport protein
MRARNLVLLAAAALIAAAPLLLLRGPSEGAFAGADGRAQAAIQEIRPDYEPWIGPVWRPPGGEVESLLFMLQAALGSGLLGYYLGLRRGQAGRARAAETDASG